eukprot:sb/3464940/
MSAYLGRVLTQILTHGFTFPADSTGSLAGISPTATCVLDSDGETGILSPSTLPFCKEAIVAYKDDLRYESVNTSNPYLSQYDMPADEDTTGCVEQNRDVFYVTQCTGKSIEYLDVGCTDELETLVGYHTLRTMDETVYWGKDILVDENLKLKLGCVNTEDTKEDICSNVDQPSHSDSKMFVRIYRYVDTPHSTSPLLQQGRTSSNLSSYITCRVSWELNKESRDTNRVMNLVAGDSSVKYRIACDPGYSFKFGVNEWRVYGYCTGTAGMSDSSKNTFSAAQSSDPDTELSCYGKLQSKQPIRTRYLGHVTDYQPIRGQYFLSVCAANPGIAMFNTNNQIQFDSVFLPEMRQEETYTATTANLLYKSLLYTNGGVPTYFFVFFCTFLYGPYTKIPKIAVFFQTKNTKKYKKIIKFECKVNYPQKSKLN